jgi:hypothetical protein
VRLVVDTLCVAVLFGWRACVVTPRSCAVRITWMREITQNNKTIFIVSCLCLGF